MKLFKTLIILLFPMMAIPQEIDSTLFDGMSMRSIGPAGMSGRVTTIDVDLSNPERIFVGTASGGVWKSESGGVTWEPIFDDQPIQNIGAIAINQQNPSEIWVGTGEGNPRNSHSSGAGIYRTIDGGITWKLMGLTKTKNIHRIIINKHNPNEVFVCALGSIWGTNKERGVYKTSNSGKDWKQSLYINDTTGCADLVVDPKNPNKLIAAMWQFGRKPYTFNSGGKGSGIYISYDGGENWKQKTSKDGLPEGILGRSGLAISASKPNIVYALVESKKTALYKSTNGGENWKKVADKNIGNRPFYYADIFCDPKNENRLYNLYSMVSRSEDGGKTFKVILPYSGVHPDHHAFWIHPDNPNYMIEGNDGGINITRDGGDSWRFIENLPVAQFYHINYDMDYPYNVYGGMQDNGSWIGPSSVWTSGGIKNHQWQEVLFGDGFDVMPRPDNNRFGFAMYQGGNVHYYDRVTGENKNVKPIHPEGEKLRFNWNGAIAQDPYRDCGIYFGSQFLHYSTDCGINWKIISPDLTTNDSTKQKQHLSGGLTIDATQAENYTTITCIAPSPLNKDVIWVGTDDGNIQLTTDNGNTWTNFNGELPGAPKDGWVPQIVCSKYNENEVFVVMNNYRNNDFGTYIYKSNNLGKKWISLTTDEIKGHAHAIVQDHVAENLLFLGTENGLFYSFNSGEEWHKWTKNYPSVCTIDLKIHPRENDLVIGTFGRAAYILDNISPMREIALNNEVLKDTFSLFKSNVGIQTSYRQPSGMRFGADAEFKGQNKGSHIRVPYYLKSKGKAKGKEDKTNWDKAFVKILNENNDTLYQYSVKVDTGIQQINWYMNKKGVRYPGSKIPEKDADDSWGGRVLPGNYKMVVVYGNLKDSVNLTVLKNPNSVITDEELLAQQFQSNRAKILINRATEGFDRLNEIEKILNKVNVVIEHQHDTLKTSINKKIGELKNEISELKEIYRKDPKFKGYDHVTKFLNNYLYDLTSYEPKSTSDEAAYKIASKKTDEAIQKINTFINEKWKPFQKEIEALNTSIFKEVETVK